MNKICKYCNKNFIINKKRKKYWWLYYKRKYCSNSCWRKHYRHILKKDIYIPVSELTKEKIEKQRKRQMDYYYQYWEKNKSRLRWNNNPKRKEYDIKRRLKLKFIALQIYSKNKIPKCKCCNEKHIEFLTIDHLDGKGNQHRNALRSKYGRIISFYQWLKNNNYPDKNKYGVLCMNCNFATRFNKKCPHQK